MSVQCHFVHFVLDFTTVFNLLRISCQTCHPISLFLIFFDFRFHFLTVNPFQFSRCATVHFAVKMSSRSSLKTFFLMISGRKLIVWNNDCIAQRIICRLAQFPIFRVPNSVDFFLHRFHFSFLG